MRLAVFAQNCTILFLTQISTFTVSNIEVLSFEEVLNAGMSLGIHFCLPKRHVCVLINPDNWDTY